MIHSQTYINKIITHGYCCIGKTGTIMSNKMRTGVDFSCEANRIRLIFLICLMLKGWNQDESGQNQGTNNITEAQMNQGIDIILRECGCNFDTNPEITENIEHYWESGYSDEDYNT